MLCLEPFRLFPGAPITGVDVRCTFPFTSVTSLVTSDVSQEIQRDSEGWSSAVFDKIFVVVGFHHLKIHLKKSNVASMFEMDCVVYDFLMIFTYHEALCVMITSMMYVKIKVYHR